MILALGNSPITPGVVHTMRAPSLGPKEENDTYTLSRDMIAMEGLSQQDVDQGHAVQERKEKKSNNDLTLGQ